MRHMTLVTPSLKRWLSLTGAALAFPAVSLLSSGCSTSPRDQYVQWVARDAWDSTCAEQAIVESFKGENRRWKIENQVYLVDVTARFKLVNPCNSGLPIVGKQYKQFETADFKQTVEMSSCAKGGEKGWSLTGKESSRCWTGPTLLGATAGAK